MPGIVTPTNVGVAGSGTQITYDPVFNQVTSITDDLGRKTLFQIDPANGNTLSSRRVVGQLDTTSGETDDVVTTYTYTSRGLLDTLTDALGRVTDYDYDVFGRVTRITYAKGTADEAVQRMEHDAAGNRDAFIDERGKRYEYDYDALNRLVLTRDPLLHETTYDYDDDGNLTSRTDARENTWESEFDEVGRIIVARDPLDHETLYDYDRAGNLVAVTDANGKTTRYEYDDRQRLVKITAADGAVTRNVYDENDNIVEVIDPRGHSTRYTYDARNRVSSATDALGNVTRYVHDAADRLLSVIDPMGRATQHAYDDLDRRVRTEYIASGIPQHVIAFAYDKMDNLLSVTDPLGRASVSSYDALNRLRTVTLAAGTADEATRRFEYDDADNRTATIDENDNRTEFVYDDASRLVTVRDAHLNETTYGYDAVGNQTSVTDRRNHTTSFEFDAINRLVTVRDPLLNETTYTYDNVGNLLTTTDPRDNVTHYEYDAVNRRTKVTDARNDSTSLGYDAAGNLVTVTDARDQTTTHAYDELDRVARTTDFQNRSTTYAYDAVGNRVNITDAFGRVMRYTYDGLDRVAEQRWVTSGAPGASGEADLVTSFTRDLAGNLLSVTDPLGNRTSYEYDDRDRTKKMIDARGRQTTYKYDDASNVTEIRDRLGRVTTYDYDALHRIESETVSSAGSPDHATGFSYDDEGNLLTISDAASRLTFTYDELGRVISEDNAGTPGAPHVVLTFAYDDAGNLQSVTDSINGSVGAITSYAYDVLNRVKSMSQSAAGGTAPGSVAEKRVEFAYNSIGLLESVTRFSGAVGGTAGIVTAYTYDSLNRLQDLVHRNGVDPVAFYGFSYDAEDRITSLTDGDGTVTYSYDGRNQLTGADYTDARTDETYAYDENGNRTSSHLHGSGYETTTANRLESDGTYDYAYDDDGNLTRRVTVGTGAVRDFGYDLRNRLVTVTDADSLGNVTHWVTYTYDALGRRIASTVDADGGGSGAASSTHFAYHGDNVILEFVDPDASGAAAPQLSVRYLHGLGTDRVLAQERVSATGTSDGTEWLLGDHLGTIRDVTDADGALVNHVRYDAFGNRTSQTSEAHGTRYGFTGRELDLETGLYYYRARYYDPSIGRFISEDPMGLEAGDSNLYRYVGNQVTSLRDPTGLNPVLTPDQIRRTQELARQRSEELALLQSIRTQAAEIGDDLQRRSEAILKAKIAYEQAELKHKQWLVDNADAMSRADFFTGYFYDAPKDIVTGTVQMVLHPIDTVKGIAHAIKNYDETWCAILEQWKTDRGKGRILGNVAWGIASGKAGKNVNKYVKTQVKNGIDKWRQPAAAPKRPANYVPDGISVGDEPIGPDLGHPVVGAVRSATPIEVTEAAIRAAMKDAPLQTQQGAVSLPVVQKYVRMLENGEIPPAIKVDGSIIVDGNHRYVAGRLFGQEPPTTPWPGGNPTRVTTWDNIKIDPTDWGNR